MKEGSSDEASMRNLLKSLKNKMGVSDTPFPNFVIPKRKVSMKKLKARRKSAVESPRTLLRQVVKEKMNRRSSVLPRDIDPKRQMILRPSRSKSKGEEPESGDVSSLVSSEDEEEEKLDSYKSIKLSSKKPRPLSTMRKFTHHVDQSELTLSSSDEEAKKGSAHKMKFHEVPEEDLFSPQGRIPLPGSGSSKSGKSYHQDRMSSVRGSDHKSATSPKRRVISRQPVSSSDSEDIDADNVQTDAEIGPVASVHRKSSRLEQTAHSSAVGKLSFLDVPSTSAGPSSFKGRSKSIAERSLTTPIKQTQQEVLHRSETKNRSALDGLLIIDNAERAGELSSPKSKSSSRSKNEKRIEAVKDVQYASTATGTVMSLSRDEDSEMDVDEAVHHSLSTRKPSDRRDISLHKQLNAELESEEFSKPLSERACIKQSSQASPVSKRLQQSAGKSASGKPSQREDSSGSEDSEERAAPRSLKKTRMSDLQSDSAKKRMQGSRGISLKSIGVQSPRKHDVSRHSIRNESFHVETLDDVQPMASGSRVQSGSPYTQTRAENTAFSPRPGTSKAALKDISLSPSTTKSTEVRQPRKMHSSPIQAGISQKLLLDISSIKGSEESGQEFAARGVRKLPEQVDDSDLSSEEEDRDMSEEEEEGIDLAVPGPSSRSQRKRTARKKRTKELHMPDVMTREIIEHFSGMSVNRSSMPLINDCLGHFWRNTMSTLTAYAKHAGRGRIHVQDVELLLFRLRMCKDKHSLNALIEKYLSLDLRAELIPIAQAKNIE